MTSEVPDTLPIGFQFHERYVIESELASQQMGKAYKASDSVLHAVVALNVLAPERRDREGIRQFRDCFRRAFRQCQGQVFEYGEWLGVPYAVVQYVDGVGAAVDVGAR